MPPRILEIVKNLRIQNDAGLDSIEIGEGNHKRQTLDFISSDHNIVLEGT